MSASTSLDTSRYVPSDGFFGQPYIDLDEWREKPAPTGMFTVASRALILGSRSCYPPPEAYERRIFQPLEGPRRSPGCLEYCPDV